MNGGEIMNNVEKNVKKEWSKPEFTVYGDMTNLTQGFNKTLGLGDGIIFVERNNNGGNGSVSAP